VGRFASLSVSGVEVTLVLVRSILDCVGVIESSGAIDGAVVVKVVVELAAEVE